MRESSLSPSLHGNYSFDINAGMKTGADRQRDRRRQYGKRKAPISSHRNDLPQPVYVRDSVSRTSRSRTGVCSIPTASLGSPLNSGPATPTKRNGSFYWSEQNNELPSTSSFVVVARPQRFQHFLGKRAELNYGTPEEEENTSPNREHFYDARSEQVASSAMRNDLESNVQNMLYEREVSRNCTFQPGCSVGSTCDSICRVKSGITG